LDYSLTLKMEAECWSTFNTPHGATSQKMELFITTAVRTLQMFAYADAHSNSATGEFV
jgi:hypothetical protein